MGLYINPGNDGFKTILNSKYVDKTGLIAVINSRLNTVDKLTCISRPRRFGKSYAAKMLCAYYDCSVDSSELFDGLEITGDESYGEYLNKFNVLSLDISSFEGERGASDFLAFMKEKVISDCISDYPECSKYDTVAECLDQIVKISGRKFIAVIDEWDAVIRDKDHSEKEQKAYLEFLRSLFKNSNFTDKVFAGAYMTGILPIKKDGSQSAISDFDEFNMLSPGEYALFFGFTDDEVRELCDEYGSDYEMMKQWYDGYRCGNMDSVYNPNSVMKALIKKNFTSYWKQSAAADSLLEWLNYDKFGPGEAVPKLMAGKEILVNPANFKNDLVSFDSVDEVMTLLIHFGYLSFNPDTSKVRIPNEEVSREFSDIIHRVNHSSTIERLRESDKLILDTVSMDAEAVSDQIEKVHMEECSPRFYNNEQALRSVIKLAYFAYRDYYIKLEELPSGTGYADIVYIPKDQEEMPALVVELKYNDSADGAIKQIKDRNYPAVLKGYGAPILLVGISYDKDDVNKKHSCVIEEIP